MYYTPTASSEQQKQDMLLAVIANHMKKCFLNWNKDTVEDTVIFNHLFELSEGKIDIRDCVEDLTDAASLMRSKKRHSNHKKSNHKKNNNRGRKRY